MNHIIDHVFLPTKLPQDGEVNAHEKDIGMLTFFRETIKQFCTSSLAGHIPLGSAVWKMTRKIVKLHRKGCLDHQELTDTFNCMAEGGKSPLYVLRAIAASSFLAGV